MQRGGSHGGSGKELLHKCAPNPQSNPESQIPNPACDSERADGRQGRPARNSLRYAPHTFGSECVPCPRVSSLVGMRTYLPRFTRAISFSISPSSGGFTTSSAELMARTGATIFARFGDG